MILEVVINACVYPGIYINNKLDFRSIAATHLGLIPAFLVYIRIHKFMHCAFTQVPN